MNCSRPSKKNRLKTNPTSKAKDPLGFPGSSNSIKMGPVQHNQIIEVYLLRGSTTLLKSKNALGAFFRGQRSHFRAPKPITAVAYKLARLVYSMLKHGMAYVDGILLYNTRCA